MRTKLSLFAIGLLTQCFPFFLYADEKECTIVEEKTPLSTNQGGYSFDYYMGLGSDCKVVALRNHSGKPLTPVRWSSPAEVFMDTNLAACPSSVNCDWLAVTLPAWNAYSDKTTLGYGVNADQYKETPEAYCNAQRQPPTRLPFTTSISGPISDEEGKSIVVGVRVSSTATGDNIKGFQLKYVIAAPQKSFSFDIIESKIPGEGPSIAVVWESAESSEFLEQLSRAEVKKIDSERPLVIETYARDIEVESKPLTLMQRGKRIFTTTAPAYRPKKE